MIQSNYKKRGEGMDKKDDINSLMKQYLDFYQRDRQKIELDQGSDFDALMKQYKTKFDQQIANEQKAIREKENARIAKKKQELELRTKQKKEQEAQRKQNRESLRNSDKKKLRQTINEDKTKFRQTYSTNEQTKPKRNYRTLIIIVVVAIIGIVGFTQLEPFSFFDLQAELNEQLSTNMVNNVALNELDGLNSIEDFDNFLAATPYLSYDENSPNYLDSINLAVDRDDLLMIDNNSPSYLLVQYSCQGASANIFVTPGNSYYDFVSDQNDLEITSLAFYNFAYPLPDFGEEVDIWAQTQLSEDYFNATNAKEIFKYYYYQAACGTHENEVIFVLARDSTKGYYGYLDYPNHQINLYYNDELDTSITIENIQNYQSDYLETITL